MCSCSEQNHIFVVIKTNAERYFVFCNVLETANVTLKQINHTFIFTREMSSWFCNFEILSFGALVCRKHCFILSGTLHCSLIQFFFIFFEKYSIVEKTASNDKLLKLFSYFAGSDLFFIKYFSKFLAYPQYSPVLPIFGVVLLLVITKGTIFFVLQQA